VSSFVDKYYDDLADVKTKLVEKVNRLLPRLETLSDSELIELSRSLDFFEEAKRLGYDKIAKDFERGLSKEVADTLKKAGTFGVDIAGVNLESLQLIMDLELDSLVSQNRELSKQLKKEVFRGLLTGESINEISTRIETEFSGNARITQSRVATGDAVSKLFRTTTQKAFEGDEEQRFKYVGPDDNKTREICKSVLGNSQNNKGFTFAEIEALAPIDGKKVTFTDGGSYNCRHEFVPV
tara:strand:+ start:1117 stop:1830 length:714 start_codon:yes stop_codon:yes gene_type:complete